MRRKFSQKNTPARLAGTKLIRLNSFAFTRNMAQFLSCWYFNFRSMRITAANDTTLCSTILIVFLRFHPGRRHTNRPQNSSRDRAHMKRPQVSIILHIHYRWRYFFKCTQLKRKHLRILQNGVKALLTLTVCCNGSHLCVKKAVF